MIRDVNKTSSVQVVTFLYFIPCSLDKYPCRLLENISFKINVLIFQSYF